MDSDNRILDNKLSFLTDDLSSFLTPVTFKLEEEKAKKVFWESLENNVPFDFKFSQEYLTYTREKLKNRGWKLVKNI
jgi:hypothetical protein